MITLVQIMENYTGKSFGDIQSSHSMLNFIKVVFDFLSEIGLPNISIKNILCPDAKKFIQICTYIINFSMFRESRKEKDEKAYKLASESMKNVNVLKKIILEKEDEAVNLNGLLKNNADKILILNEEISDLDREFKNAHNEFEQLNFGYQKIKSNSINLNNNLSSLELVEHNLKEDTKLLEKQIVTNPEKLFEIVTEMKLLVEQENQNIKDLKISIFSNVTELSEMTHKVENIKKIHKNQLLIKDLEKNYNLMKHKKIQGESQIKMISSSIRNKEIRNNHILRQLDLIEEKVKELASRDKKNREEMEDKINRIKEEYDNLTREKERNGEGMNKNQKMTHELLYKKSQFECDFQMNISEIYGMITNLLAQIEIMKL